MKRWMAILSFDQQNFAQIQALIPAEQAHVRELMGQGIMEALYIASDGARVWLVLKGESRVEIEQTLSKFPLHDYFEYDITGLN